MANIFLTESIYTHIDMKHERKSLHSKLRRENNTCTIRRTNTKHAPLINHDDNSRWSKQSSFDHTCSAVARLIALTNGSPRWSPRVDEDAAARKKKTEQAIGSRNEATLATTRSPLAWRLAHSKRLVLPLARNRTTVSSLKLNSSKASLRDRVTTETARVMENDGVKMKKLKNEEMDLLERANCSA